MLSLSEECPNIRTVSIDEIERAKDIIDPIFLNTPCLRSMVLDKILGVDLSMKLETLNPIGSFKGRGTSLFVEKLENPRPLVCASAGNFGQGLAYAAMKNDLVVTVFAAESANKDKLEAMKNFKANVVLKGKDLDEAKSAARAYAEERGYVFVEDGAIPEIAEGAGTIALECLQQAEKPDVFLIPVGNGALAHGICSVLKKYSPSTTIVLVTASGAPAMSNSIRDGALKSTEKVETIADGIAVREPVPYATEALMAFKPELAVVTDKAILAAMRLLHSKLGLVIEPSGAVGIAASLSDPGRWQGLKVATILCGANIDQSLRPKLVTCDA